MNTPFYIYEKLQRVTSKKVDKYIEIVGSSNPRLNAMDRDSQLSIKAVLSKRYAKVAITIVDDLADLERLASKNPDLVVLGMKLILLEPLKSYDDSHKIWLSDYLQNKGINFTGSDTKALALEFDKPIAKQKVIDAGLDSSKYFISKINNPNIKHDLNYPLFVKPTNRGDSKGIDDRSVVYTEPQLESKILSIHADCGSDALIEEYLSGREFSVAVIRQSYSQDLIALPVEITAPTNEKGHSFLSEKVKKSDTERVIAVTDIKLKNSLNLFAINVFKALGASDYGRIDMRLDFNGVPSFIEANLMPGLSDHGYLSKCFNLNAQGSYVDMILSITELGLEKIATNPKEATLTMTNSQAKAKDRPVTAQFIL
jgi:D-alanine-D-alanine ligase